MYGHAHLLEQGNACWCGKAGTVLSDKGNPICAAHALEAERAVLRAEEDAKAQVPAQY